MREFLKSDPATAASRIMRALTDGTLKADEVHAYFRAQNLPTLMEKNAAFVRGVLFGSQRHTLQVWAAATDYAQDLQVWCDYRAVADLCGLPYSDAAYVSVHDFAGLRVLPGPAERKRMTADIEGFRRWNWELFNDHYCWRWMAEQ